MKMNSFLSLVGFSLITLRLIAGQTSVEFLLLDSKINSLNTSFLIYQQKTDATITDMKAGMLANKNDIAALKTRVTTAEDKLAAIDKQAQANRNASATNQANIVKIQDDIMYLKTRTDTLAASSDLWKQNFQVVNRTFEELKKKYALVIPGVPRA